MEASPIFEKMSHLTVINKQIELASNTLNILNKKKKSNRYITTSVFYKWHYAEQLLLSNRLTLMQPIAWLVKYDLFLGFW